MAQTLHYNGQDWEASWSYDAFCFWISSQFLMVSGAYSPHEYIWVPVCQAFIHPEDLLVPIQTFYHCAVSSLAVNVIIHWVSVAGELMEQESFPPPPSRCFAQMFGKGCWADNLSLGKQWGIMRVSFLVWKNHLCILSSSCGWIFIHSVQVVLDHCGSECRVFWTSCCNLSWGIPLSTSQKMPLCSDWETASNAW